LKTLTNSLFNHARRFDGFLMRQVTIGARISGVCDGDLTGNKDIAWCSQQVANSYYGSFFSELQHIKAIDLKIRK